MATLRDIKRRMTAVSSIQQITKAMKMVATARLRKAQDAIFNSRPYSIKIKETLNRLSQSFEKIDNPLFELREPETVAIMVVASDKGLCGSFNMNAIRAAVELINSKYSRQNQKGNVFLICLGKKAYDYFSRRNYKIAAQYINMLGKHSFGDASSIANLLIKGFLEKEFDRVEIVYNQFKSVMQQQLTVKTFLPIEIEEDKTVKASDLNYIFEPDAKKLFEKLLPKYLNSQIWRVILESFASELGARMTAMDMASENAKELIRVLNLTYNKARQAAITKEILEIVSGANALKKV